MTSLQLSQALFSVFALFGVLASLLLCSVSVVAATGWLTARLAREFGASEEAKELVVMSEATDQPATATGSRNGSRNGGLCQRHTSKPTPDSCSEDRSIEQLTVSDLRPFFGFYGGKWRDAIKHYPAPRHRTIVEPFAGSAGFSVRYAHLDIVLCEADPIIASVWKYLTKVEPREILEIPDVPLDGTVEDLNLVQEAEWLVGFWLNRGASRPRKRPSKWMREGIRPGSFWGDRVRHTIASQVESIRHWKVHNGSYEDSPVVGPATWFVDPPYQHAGKHYTHGSDRIDFCALGAWCRSRDGQVIVCENDGADWLPFRALADVKTTRAGQRSKEVIWTNQDQ